MCWVVVGFMVRKLDAESSAVGEDKTIRSDVMMVGGRGTSPIVAFIPSVDEAATLGADLTNTRFGRPFAKVSRRLAAKK
jgi:hypothetical protein